MLTNPSLAELADLATREFSYLESLGFTQVAREVLGENYYRGGFNLRYSSSKSNLTLNYGDMEFEIQLENTVLFNAHGHPGFAGNNLRSRKHKKSCLS